MINWQNEKENLQHKIIDENLSYEEIGRQYRCSGSNIKKAAIRLGIPIIFRRKINKTETFNKGKKLIHTCINCGTKFAHKTGYSNKFCSPSCEREYKHQQKYNKILTGDSSIMRANYTPKYFKDDILKEQGGVCAICGMKPIWNGKPLVFIIDHIDGHASHNYRSNLRVICPNCDSQLDTYKSRNKCGERSYYRYHKYDNAQE